MNYAEWVALGTSIIGLLFMLDLMQSQRELRKLKRENGLLIAKLGINQIQHIVNEKQGCNKSNYAPQKWVTHIKGIIHPIDTTNEYHRNESVYQAWEKARQAWYSFFV
jgi:hypothetical protein